MISTPQHQSKIIPSVSCAVVTVSDTRTPETDSSGSLIRDLLSAGGHRIVSHEIVPDEMTTIRERMKAICTRPDCQAILLTGGTGVSPRDTTYEAVRPLFEKELEGFGELFRMLSYAEVGASAMLSRAVAGVREGRIIFVMPGSTAAVRLALEKLVLPAISHIAWLLKNG